MKKYRMLLPCELVKAGDEFRRSSGEWVVLYEGIFVDFMKAIRFEKGDLPVRRSIDD